MITKRYKLAALDMDNTLLTRDLQLLPETAQDVEEACRKGLQAAFCSGRAVPEIMIYKHLLPSVRYGICMSGAVLFDFETKSCVFRKAIPLDLVEKVISVTDELGGMVELLTEKDTVARADEVPRMKDFCADQLQQLFEEVAVKTDDLMKEARLYDGIPKINLFYPSVEIREEAKKRFEGLPFKMHFEGRTALELNPAGTSKAKCLVLLADHLGISLEDTVGIGDSYNDVEMLKTVGLPIAMANARPEVKAVCGIITDDCDHNGAGKALRKLIR